MPLAMFRWARRRAKISGPMTGAVFRSWCIAKADKDQHRGDDRGKLRQRSIGSAELAGRTNAVVGNAKCRCVGCSGNLGRALHACGLPLASLHRLARHQMSKVDFGRLPLGRTPNHSPTACPLAEGPVASMAVYGRGCGRKTVG